MTLRTRWWLPCDGLQGSLKTREDHTQAEALAKASGTTSLLLTIAGHQRLTRSAQFLSRSLSARLEAETTNCMFRAVLTRADALCLSWRGQYGVTRPEVTEAARR